MSRASTSVDLNPAVLKWARESSGWQIKDIAEKLKIQPKKYLEWESTGRGIRLTALKALAKHYKRSLAVFFLPNPPREPNPPKDFRVLPDRRDRFEKKTLLAIRRATRLQRIAAELSEALGQPTEPRIATAKLEDNPELVSSEERTRLGITVEAQFRWKNESEALDLWRESIEKRNVSVFSQTMPIDDARGFSLTHLRPWAIVLNSSDAIRGRIFTLFHEYGHLLLHRPGVCIPSGEWTSRNHFDDAEVWCNRFAAAFLLPKEAVLTINEQNEMESPELADYTLGMSRRFKVSQEVVIRRLMTLQAITEKQYLEQLQRLHALPRRKKQGGFVSPPLASVKGRGKLFTRLVLESKEKGVLTYRDVSDYLSIRLKYLERVQTLAVT